MKQEKLKLEYNPAVIEKKWQTYWQENQIFAIDMVHNQTKEKYYCLDMFPYPSGSGLHVGHWRGYVVSDVWSRYKFLHNYNVLHPMGWDSFGLPAENDAIKKRIHPKITTSQNINNIKRQLGEIGAIYDWNKEINTSSPEYYKWTQWIFLKMFKRGLAYRKSMPINWCPSCKTGLANEEVINGCCERCGHKTTRKDLMQWMLKITQYAENLLQGLKDLNWPEKVKKMQENWIGKSEGAEIVFRAISANDNKEYNLPVFTTRPDTLFGATYVVLAPEHELVLNICSKEQESKVKKYIEMSRNESDIERTDIEKEKTGEFTGAFAINPVNNEKLPIWISDYVLISYGTGGIMSVPAHDSRDFDFAGKYNLPIVEVIANEKSKKDERGNLLEVYEGEGTLVNSGDFNGEPSDIARWKIVEFLKGRGKRAVSYKLRDWVFSRQRYWGEPIPIVYCDKCGEVPVPEESLPVLLPDVEKYQPSGSGKSPLANIKEWLNTTCPECGGKAQRETDTMPQWAGSSWYFLRYPSADNNVVPFDKKLTNEWLPVDQYVGGIEHAILHLLYARFFTKVLYDAGEIDFDEPFSNLFNQGMIYRQGAKMSKSKGNVVNPDDLVQRYGGDSLRLYELFIGPPELDSEWNDKGIIGMHKFLLKVWKYTLDLIDEKGNEQIIADEHLEYEQNLFVKDITERIESFKFNTAISRFMEFLNYLNKEKIKVNKKDWHKFLILLSPFTPHICEELWQICGGQKSIFFEKWPEFSRDKIESGLKNVTIAVQIDGKFRGTIETLKDTNEEQIKDMVSKKDKYIKFIKGKTIAKVIFINNKLINFILK